VGWGGACGYVPGIKLGEGREMGPATPPPEHITRSAAFDLSPCICDGKNDGWGVEIECVAFVGLV